MTSYYVVDAPGYHGDWVRVYRVCRTLEAARAACADEALRLTAELTGAGVHSAATCSRTETPASGLSERLGRRWRWGGESCP